VGTVGLSWGCKVD